MMAQYKAYTQALSKMSGEAAESLSLTFPFFDRINKTGATDVIENLSKFYSVDQLDAFRQAFESATGSIDGGIKALEMFGNALNETSEDTNMAIRKQEAGQKILAEMKNWTDADWNKLGVAEEDRAAYRDKVKSLSNLDTSTFSSDITTAMNSNSGL